MNSFPHLLTLRMATKVLRESLLAMAEFWQCLMGSEVRRGPWERTRTKALLLDFRDWTSALQACRLQLTRHA